MNLNCLNKNCDQPVSIKKAGIGFYLIICPACNKTSKLFKTHFQAVKEHRIDYIVDRLGVSRDNASKMLKAGFKNEVKEKKAKKKKTDYQLADELLIKVHSVFIRLRDSDADGNGPCISCGKPIHWSKANNGHFVKRQFKPTRFHDQNCNLQCVKCNNWLQGNDVKYAENLDKKFGEGTAEKLKMIKGNKSELTAASMNILVSHYRREIAKLLTKKNFTIKIP